MSASALPAERKVVKSRGAQISSPTYAHRASFGDLFEEVEKETGNPDVDKVLYSDPMGFRTRGSVQKNALHLPSKMYEGTGEGDGWRDVYDYWNSLQPGARMELREAAKKVSKAVGRDNFSLPIFVSPEVYVSTGEQTPFADMAPRVAVAEETIEADEQVALGGVSSFAEEGPYPNADDSYDPHEYTVTPYGRESEVTDFVQLSAGSLRSTISTTEDAMGRAMRQYEEEQVFKGTANGDADGFPGLPDLMPTSNVLDAETETENENGLLTNHDIVRQMTRIQRAGGSWDAIAHFTDHETWADLHQDTEDLFRFQSPDGDLNFGYSALQVAGQPVFKTHGLNAEDTGRYFYSVDMRAWYMGMLQDHTMHPLAKTGPTETFAVDAYGTLVGDGVSHVYAYENVGGASA